RLIHDGREALLSPASDDALNAIVAVLGRPIAREMLRIPPYDTDRLAVSGFAGRPTLTRANRANQLLYVNGRTVRSPLYYRAMDEAYRSTMPSGPSPARPARSGPARKTFPSKNRTAAPTLRLATPGRNLTRPPSPTPFSAAAPGIPAGSRSHPARRPHGREAARPPAPVRLHLAHQSRA